PQTSPPPQPAPDPAPARPRETARTSPPISEGPLERCLGSRNAPILIEVFSDYQCPACRQYYLETIQFVLQEYAATGKVCVVYYEFPLNQHKHAREAARYAQAALRLSPNHWLRVNDTLYTLQPQWSTDGQIEPLVARVLPKADMDKVRQSVTDLRINALIDHDVAQGRSRGVTGTPTTFLTVKGQTHRINGPVQYAIMKQFLDKQLGQ
ncbi:MAG: DsbA family protein, partial [Candidatus Acidiferrales bacterium]